MAQQTALMDLSQDMLPKELSYLKKREDNLFIWTMSVLLFVSLLATGTNEFVSGVVSKIVLSLGIAAFIWIILQILKDLSTKKKDVLEAITNLTSQLSTDDTKRFNDLILALQDDPGKEDLYATVIKIGLFFSIICIIFF